MILIATIAVENEAADNMNQHAESGYLIGNTPISYSDRILSGDPKVYPEAVAEYKA